MMQYPRLSGFCFLLLYQFSAAASEDSGARISAAWFSGTAPIAVDGDLSDWETMQVDSIALSHSLPLVGPGRTAARGSFRTAADRDRIYLAIRVDGVQPANLLPSGLIADVQFYSGASAPPRAYKRYRGIDGLIRIFNTAASGSFLSGKIRLNSSSPRLVECPGIWDVRGVHSAVKLAHSGIATELSFPFELFGWKAGDPPPGPLRINIRLFGLDRDGAPAGVQWSDDSLNTAETSHEMLGEILYDRVVPTAYNSPSQPIDPSIRLALSLLAKDDFGAAAHTLELANDERLFPLLAVVLDRMADPRAESLLRRLSTSRSENIAAWASNRLAFPRLRTSVPLSERLHMIINDPRSEGLGARGMQFADLSKWDEAIRAFHEISDGKAIPAPYRTWALLQIQRAQLSMGNLAESVKTGLDIQSTAPDGDPSRAESFTTLLAGYYGPGERLERARVALSTRTGPIELSSLIATVVGKRAGGLRCRQALELGELQRVDGSTDRAAKQYQLVAEMNSCPNEDRAWALLLLQRLQASGRNIPSVLSAASRIASDFSDEWDIRLLSLQNLESLGLTTAELGRYRELLVNLRATLSASVSEGWSPDGAIAEGLLQRIDRIGSVRLPSTSAMPAIRKEQ